jgi:predicted component of type VI protein secretion system
VDHDDPTSVFHSETFRKVSRVHCEVELRDDGSVLVRDLSRNGLLVGGERVTDTFTLAPGSKGVTIQIGDAAVGVIEIVPKRA